MRTLSMQVNVLETIFIESLLPPQRPIVQYGFYTPLGDIHLYAL